MPLGTTTRFGRAETGEVGAGSDKARPASGVRRNMRPYLFLLPALVFLGLFVYWPVLLTGFLSLFQWNMISPTMTFVGLGNFASLLTSPEFFRVLAQSVLYVLLALLGNFLLPLGLAMLTLMVPRRHSELYQALLFAPTVVATSIGALLWQFVYLPSGGLLNAALAALGLPGNNWLNDPDTVIPAVGVVATWNHLGFNYLIALAGLMAVPREQLEAARMDGATGWPLLRFVIIPLLMPTVLFLALTTVLQALPNAFVPIEVLTGGGPAEASNNLLYDLYRTGFRFFQVGTASAQAVLLIALLGVFAVWQFRLLDRSVTYDR